MNSLTNYDAIGRYSAKAPIFSITAIAAALGMKDPYTRDHARRVAIYARRLATRIGLNPVEIENIRLGGLLHDIGKIGLSERIGAESYAAHFFLQSGFWQSFLMGFFSF